ncbi:NAD kinase 2, chloroplastic [Porphyridium purpureum]|uniref:NAD kinase 2, chloroplastic n=1 Tax=Porphyridium purpureum TaxID=35688 RepID=A0A5J4YX33_PORPP|nr:NAD kinase 2, chloroplastic [Porphyridium purpureum]|eukprot:POR3736..scf209_3
MNDRALAMPESMAFVRPGGWQSHVHRAKRTGDDELHKASCGQASSRWSLWKGPSRIASVVPCHTSYMAAGRRVAFSMRVSDVDLPGEQTKKHPEDAARRKGHFFVVWGPPGTGKTTLCEHLSSAHNMVHISSGALLRAHLRNRTELGEQAREFVEQGKIVPDEIMVKILLERIQQPDCREGGFLGDGFPRSLGQFDAMREAGFVCEKAFMLHAPRSVLRKRIQFRRVDPVTKHIYNLRYLPPASQEIRDRLVMLWTDTEEKIETKLSEYGRTSAVLFDMLSKSIVSIDAEQPPDVIFRQISRILQDEGIPALPHDFYHDVEYGPPEVQAGYSGYQTRKSRAAADAEAGIEPGGWLGPWAEESDISSGSDNDGVYDPGSRAAGNNGAVARDSEGKNRSLRNPKIDGMEDTDSASQYGSRADSFLEDASLRFPGKTSLQQTTRGGKVPVTLIRCDGYVCERESVEDGNIAFRGAATEQVMLVWNERPRTVLLLCKKDKSLLPTVLETAQNLMSNQSLRVIVEPFVQTEALAKGMNLEPFTRGDKLENEIDFVVCLGGDGLILHVSTLFANAVPPVICFNFGSLGFLTPFVYEDFDKEIESVIEGNLLMSLRMRLHCTVFSEAKPDREFHVLNELVVDRGASSYLSYLDCFCDDKYITTVQADGIIVSTPTGSTAYSMSAGGSMVHPSVPAILFTPVCPHSLSFRPIVFPDSARLRICVSQDSRAVSWASFDGKFRQQLRRGDGVLVQMSLYPVPTINKTDHTGDWFGGLSRAFNFNMRAQQKPLDKIDEKPRH